MWVDEFGKLHNKRDGRVWENLSHWRDTEWEGRRKGEKSCFLFFLEHFISLRQWVKLTLFFKKTFIYLFLFLAILGFPCSLQAFSSNCWEPGCSLLPGTEGLLQPRPLLPRSTGSRLTGSVAPWHVESSWTRDWTRVPCIGRQILIHCATREVQ